MNGPTLLAMAPSGEIAMVRHRGWVWLVRSQAAGGVKAIEQDVAKRAAAYHGFLWVDREFPDWPAMEEYRQERAAEFAPMQEIDRDELDADDVAGFLEVGRRWVAEGDTDRARKLGLELLGLPVVRADADLNAEAIAFLRGLEDMRLDTVPEARADLPEEFQERWDTVLAA